MTARLVAAVLALAASLSLAACEPPTYEPWVPCDLDTALLDTLGEEPEDCTDSKHGGEACLAAALEEGAVAVAVEQLEPGFRIARAVDAGGALWELDEWRENEAMFTSPPPLVVVHRRLCTSPRVDRAASAVTCDEWDYEDERLCPDWD